MSWIRRAEPAHTCVPPRRDRTRAVSGLPTASGTTTARWIEMAPDGHLGDLWQCDHCHELWRIGDACDWCDAYGHRAHGGQHLVGLAWRPATLWQRIRHRRAGRGDVGRPSGWSAR